MSRRPLAALLLAAVFRETLEEPDNADLSPGIAFRRIREAFGEPDLRGAYFTELVFLTGFAFFTAFFNVFLVDRLGYGPREIGLFFSALGGGFFVVQLFAVEPIKERLGEVWTLRAALVGIAVAIAAVAFVQQTWQLFALVPAFALTNGLIGPNLASLVSRQAPHSEQGRVLGIRSSVQALGQSVSPPLAGPIAAAGTPATPILVGAALSPVAAVTFAALVRLDALDDAEPVDSSTEET